MSKFETLAAEVKPLRESLVELAPTPHDLSRPENRHREINARRSRTEDPDALRRIRSL